MKFCNGCGKELNKTQAFCSNCGKKVDEHSNDQKQGINEKFIATHSSNQANNSVNQPKSPANKATNASPSTDSTERVTRETKKKFREPILIVSAIVVGLVAYLLIDTFSNKEEDLAQPAVEQNLEQSEATVANPEGKSESNEVETHNLDNASVAVNDEKGESASSSKPVPVEKEEAGDPYQDFESQLEELQIYSSDGQAYRIGDWTIEEEENGDLSIWASQIPSNVLQEIFAMYDRKEIDPLQLWAKVVYGVAEEISTESNRDFKLYVGNICVGEFPETLPSEDRMFHSGSCGYSIPVLEGTGKEDLTLIVTEMVYAEKSEAQIDPDVYTENEYILPDSDVRVLSESEIASLSNAELRIARNEIFARHGYVFNSEDLQQYFGSKTWYQPDPSYKGALSKTEESNVTLLENREAQRD